VNLLIEVRLFGAIRFGIATERAFAGVFMQWLPAVCAAVLLFRAAAQAQDDAADLLRRVRRTVMGTVEGLPKYVCTQTIDRARYEPDARYLPDSRTRSMSCDSLAARVNSATWKRQLSSLDRLRLDVAVTRSRPGLDSEMYSWAGEEHFDVRDLFEMVRDGAVSTGSFSSMLASIFGGEDATFSYNGDTTLGGRLLSEFGFRVPLEKSHYSYIVGSGDRRYVTLDYGGTFLTDPTNSDLVRLVIRASHLPEESSTCEITQTLNYGWTKLHDVNFLLPTLARITAVHTDGSEAENVIHYSGCHEFTGKSTIHFDSLPEAGIPGSRRDAPRELSSLPSDLRFTVLFTENIDLAAAAAGDPVRAKLKTAIRDQSSHVLAPEGSAVIGRIVGIRHFFSTGLEAADSGRARGQRPSLIIRVRLEAIDIGGMSFPLKAKFDNRVARFPNASGALARRAEIGDVGSAGDSEAVFEFFNSGRIVTSGLQSNWLTR
jgi:hypothetical protein